MKEYRDLINQEIDVRKREIVKQLIPLASEVYKKMERLGVRRWSNYRSIWNTIEWKKAKVLLIDYFRENGSLICDICKERILVKDTLLHHKEYPKETYLLFLPSYCQIIHKKCHVRVHEEEISERVGIDRDTLFGKRKGSEKNGI